MINLPDSHKQKSSCKTDFCYWFFAANRKFLHSYTHKIVHLRWNFHIISQVPLWSFFFWTRPVRFFRFFGIAARALILFAAERAQNLGCPHGALFSNFQPEVPQKFFWNPEKIDFFAKKYFQNFFGGTSGRKFEKRAPWGHPKFFAHLGAKRIRTLTAISLTKKNCNWNWPG